jgi:hypothetical protein
MTMNLGSTILVSAAHAAELPGDIVAWFLRLVGDSIGLLADDSRPDSWLGILTSCLAGVATALAVGIILSAYFRSGHRSAGDIARHGLAAALVLGLLAFVAYDMRHATFAYLGINPAKPSIEFEIRLPKATVIAMADSQVELRTDRNQTLAELQGTGPADEDGRSVLKGSVRLDYRTTDRVVVLNLPGQAQCEFRLRLAANPTRSDQFGPWHLADRVASPQGREATRSQQNDAFAIRYRVL